MRKNHRLLDSLIACISLLPLLSACHGSYEWQGRLDNNTHYTSDPPEAYPDHGGTTDAGAPIQSHRW